MIKSGKFLCFGLVLTGIIASEGTAISKRHAHGTSHLRSVPAYNYSPSNRYRSTPGNAAGTVCHVPLPYTYNCEP
jgi:hypothetical protein